MQDFEAYFKISYGLYVISAQADALKNGYIGNTVFQVTAEPAKLAISCSKNNFTTEMIEKSGYFSASVLEQNAKSELIGAFGYKSGRDIDKFANFNHKTSANNCPILIEDTLAWFECKVVDKFDIGTHFIFIGEVIDFDLLNNNAEPITYAYYRAVKKGKAPKNAPTYQKEDGSAAPSIQQNWVCPACSYIYDQEVGDPDSGIAPGTKFEDIPDDWECPVCGLSKADFILK